MNFQVVEDAIRAWIKTSTGFADRQIYFANQNGAQPPDRPFIAITVGTSIAGVGFPEVKRTTDLTQANGSEVQQDPLQIYDMRVTVQAFAENTVSYPVPSLPFSLPNSSGRTAVDLLVQCQTALGLESVNGALNAAGLGSYDWGTVRRADALVETYFEGRAILEVGFYLSDSADERTGYINEVSGTGTTGGDDARTAPFDIVG